MAVLTSGDSSEESAGDSANGRDELVRVERLADDGVRARGGVVDPGEQDDAVVPRAGEQLRPVLAAQCEVEQHDGDRLRGERGPRVREPRRLDHAKALELEIHAAEQADPGVVVHDQHHGPGSSHEARQHTGIILALNLPAGTRTTRYASEIAGLWHGLAGALRELDVFAAEPWRLADEGAAEALASLQYALHSSSELVLGLQPPRQAARAHEELTIAVEDARDMTAEVAAAVRHGGIDAATPLVWEWRGVLFRVRLARRHLTQAPKPTVPPAPKPRRERPLAALVATVLTVLGAAAAAGGAGLAQWPLWAAGFALVGLAVVAYRPPR